MAYMGEKASKIGHLDLVNSEWIQALIKEFESVETGYIETTSEWKDIVRNKNTKPLNRIWVTDGSFVSVKSQNISTTLNPSKEVAFVKTALMSIDKKKLDAIDKDFPHPLQLKKIMRDSALLHMTVFPLRNITTARGSNYDAVRHIIHDSLLLDKNGEFYETLKWLSFQKWDEKKHKSPAFECPHLCCQKQIDGFSYDQIEEECPHCGNKVFLTDMLGFHLDMLEDSAPEAIASSYMLITEHLMLFTAIRLLWNYSDKSVLDDTLFIKDGPLSLRSQYSKLVENIRNFLEYAKNKNRPIYIIGQEKSGVFVEHLSSIARYISPKEQGDLSSYSVLTHGFVHKDVYRTPNVTTSYGKRTNWGEKVYFKYDPSTFMVLNMPVGLYKDRPDFPKYSDVIGLDRILATIPSLISYQYPGGLYPIELANGIASLSSYPSAKILERFME